MAVITVYKRGWPLAHAIFSLVVVLAGCQKPSPTTPQTIGYDWAAPPTKQWDKTFGGERFDTMIFYDYGKPIISTSDGGFLFGRTSQSNRSGDKSEDSKGGSNYWLVKTDSTGHKQWDKTLGGAGSDRCSAIIPTADGGYLLGGTSSSSFYWLPESDRSEPSRGGNDYWIIKINAQGEKQWDKTFGGNYDDILTSVLATPDGGYLLIGYSDSGKSAEKSEGNINIGVPPYSRPDIWIVKIDAVGNKQWDRTLGGKADDVATSACSTSDGGFIVVAESSSDASRDKSESSQNSRDYWVLKLDNTGQKQWDKTLHAAGYDTPTSVVQSTDGGYLIGGYSDSGISAFKSEPSRGGQDYWIVKLTATGQKQWDKTFGGNDSDYLQDIGKTPDGGYILAGTSRSSPSNEKSEVGRGDFDFWLVKVDAQGEKQWDKTLGGLSTEYMGGVVVLPIGGYMIAGTSGSNRSFEKSDDSRGFFDYWLVKLQ